MPWHVGSDDSCPASKPYAVIKDADGSVEGCHSLRIAAEKQVAALYASEASKAVWSGSYISNLPDTAFACIDPGGSKEDGKTVPRSLRHYPHHTADGAVDLPHLRNALSRLGQTGTTTCGADHLRAHARALKIGEFAKAREDRLVAAVKAMQPDEEAAWLHGEIPRRLLAYPFSGPLPGGKAGLDMDGEYFDEETDIKPDWFPERPLLWNHGLYPRMGADLTLIGKATNLGDAAGPSDVPDEEGWWVDVWLKAGEMRTRQIEQLIKRGGKLFGSAGSSPHMVKRGSKGHIDCWPYMEQSLSTAPQNTRSSFRSAKALLTAYDEAEIPVEGPVRDLLIEFEESVAHLRANLSTDREAAAKAGRELSGMNMSELDEWAEALSSVLNRLDQMRARVRDRYAPKPPASGAPNQAAPVA